MYACIYLFIVIYVNIILFTINMVVNLLVHLKLFKCVELSANELTPVNCNQSINQSVY